MDYTKVISKKTPLKYADYLNLELAEFENGGNIFRLEINALHGLKKMLEKAKNDNINLYICSAFRSIEYQQEIIHKSILEYMSDGLSRKQAEEKTNKEILPPLASEHNAGLAIDFCLEDGEIREDFENTKEFEWLVKNARKFGYILRYKREYENITGIIYEPWHFRFVGMTAEEIYTKGICLEEY